MTERNGKSNGPHKGQPVLATGRPFAEAQAAMVLLHGRGGTAEDIMSLVEHLTLPGFTYLAPQAAGNEWYPQRFMVPPEQNEPWLSSGLALLAHLVGDIEEEGIPAERIVILGFSQGACLALEYATHYPRRYGGLVAFSGALIGPLNSPRPLTGSLMGTPVFLGCSDVDQHVPLPYVRHSAEVMRRLNGNVTERIYPGMGHTINEHELAHVRELMTYLVSPAASESPALA